MENLVSKFLAFYHKENPTISIDISKSNYLQSSGGIVDKFIFVYKLIIGNKLKEVIKGKGEYGTYYEFPPAPVQNEFGNTDRELIIKILFFLIKENVLNHIDVNKTFTEILEEDEIIITFYKIN